MLESAMPAAAAERTLLLVDDDRPFLQRFARAMEARGFEVTAVDTVGEGMRVVETSPPAFAVVDMRLQDGNGLDVVESLKSKRPDARSIILTGYANLATAVTAVKIGAYDYIAKPADADEIAYALTSNSIVRPEPPQNPMSPDRVRWEHIQRVYEQSERNVSETARRLGMHRRTLQRILSKRAPR
jgi:two-component system response regulator RegA